LRLESKTQRDNVGFPIGVGLIQPTLALYLPILLKPSLLEWERTWIRIGSRRVCPGGHAFTSQVKDFIRIEVSV
jgi:hypothetical protein